MYTKGTSPWQASVSTPAPASAPTQNDDAKAGGAMFALLAIFAATIGFAIYRRKPKPKSQSADPGAAEKRTGRVYYDYDQFKLAMQLWDRDRQLFEQNETARLTQLNEQVKKGGPLTSVGCLGFIIATFVVGGAYGAGAGWGTIILGLFVVGALASAEEQFRRWRYKMVFVRREFDEPEPIYQPPRQADPPPPRRDPPPRSEPPPRTEPGRPVDPTRITTMRQAYEILGLPPGRISMEAARIAYRARIAEYHPDKVAHLGQELRELAARKALEINLAMQYVEEHSTAH